MGLGEGLILGDVMPEYPVKDDGEGEGLELIILFELNTLLGIGLMFGDGELNTLLDLGDGDGLGLILILCGDLIDGLGVMLIAGLGFMV